MTNSTTFIADLPTVNDIHERVQDSYYGLLQENRDGSMSPTVCCICDEFILYEEDIKLITLKKMEKARDILSWSTLAASKRVVAIEQHYTLSNTNGLLDGIDWISELALSPRGSVRKNSDHHLSKPGFTACRTCKNSVDRGQVPLYGIINHNYVGCAPSCLTELTQVELALITPMKSFGYVFHFAGGWQQQLKGTMVFMRVKERKIAEAMTQVENFGLPDHMIVLATGKLTARQKQKVEERRKIRVDKVMIAVEWLCCQHSNWKSLNMDELREKVSNTQPVFVDESKHCEASNSNVEDEEVFTCYHPDGATTHHAGGFDEPGAFTKYVEKMRSQGFEPQLKFNLNQEFVKDNNHDTLVSSSLLQFPYGVGGLDEFRIQQCGSRKRYVDMEDYLDHLSKLSDPVFHTPKFQLIMYSIKSKVRLLNMSRLQLKGKCKAQNLAEGINVSDLDRTIRHRKLGNYGGGSVACNQLLDSVHACSRAVSHTNEASKIGRSTGEAMQHHLGTPSIFLTVSFDDENSFYLQVLCNNEIDNEDDITALSENELKDRQAKRRMIRLQFPGLTAINFEMMLHILTRDVIGWNMQENCPTDKPGFFGVPFGFSLSVEEQGRKTLHGHMSIWILGYRKLRKLAFFGSEQEKRGARMSLCEYYDHVSSTEMFPTGRYDKQKAFDHDCSKEQRYRSLPEVVNDQQLRWLRHKCGYKECGGVFATCPDCNRNFTYEDLLGNYLRKDLQYCQPVNRNVDDTADDVQDDRQEDLSIPKSRLFAEAVKYQKTRNSAVPIQCLNALYQHHVSCHVKGCFKCSKKNKRKHVCGPLCECRYRLPDRKRHRTTVDVEDEASEWFEWTGEKKSQPILQILPKRTTYDLFQNVSCPAISNSKFTCNSNIALITDGPIAAYQYKYQHKNTQEDDTEQYGNVSKRLKSFQGRKYDNDRSEAMSIIMRAAFAHQKTNVINPPLAAYLTRHDSRFYFSHSFVYCPLTDVVRIHNKQDISGEVKYEPSGNSYFENQGLHYLCRHEDLEDESLMSFFEGFEVTFVSEKISNSTKNDPVLRFQPDTGHFKHPSAITRGQGSKRKTYCRQGAKDRLEREKVKISQWEFPNTSTFGANILTCPENEINGAMEKYSQRVLTLMLPHRCTADLKPDYDCSKPYTVKLREVYTLDALDVASGKEAVVFTDRNKSLLQNIQNAAYNSFHYKLGQDDLQRNTAPFESANDDGDLSDDDEEEPTTTEDVVDEDTYTELLRKCTEYDVPVHDTDPEFLPAALKNFDFADIRNKGKQDCGVDIDVPVPDAFDDTHTELAASFLTHVTSTSSQHGETNEPGKVPERKTYTIRALVELLLKRSVARSRNVWEGKNINVSDANGSVANIRTWARKALGDDRRQRRAFESIVSAFLLTFFDDIHEGDDLETGADVEGSRVLSKFRLTRIALRKLKGSRKDVNTAQLLCLLHGPGGSGKSTVINLVIAYAKSFCENLGHPFGRRTIVVSAISGVAATLLHGETTHSVLHLNKSELKDEFRDEWTDTRLLIIDEISFASPSMIEKMQQTCCFLLREKFRKYGGLSIVFAGDYSQLEPVNMETVYNQPVDEYQGMLNCLIELEGTHRFKDDPEWGRRLRRFREGVPTLEDIQLINRECVVSAQHYPPQGIQIASYTNKNRDAINTAIFEEYCINNQPDDDDEVLESAVVILMDDLEIMKGDGSYTTLRSNTVKRHFYENISEDDAVLGTKKNRRGRVDPMLKLYPRCPMMYTENTDVANGIANGSRVRVVGVKIKPAEQAFPLQLDCGTTVNALFASQVHEILVEHECPDIVPRRFAVTSKTVSFNSELNFHFDDKVVAKMKGTQFPIISNTCTTGHKLQGCSVPAILVNDWDYKKNWAYVVLSRVRTMKGLYLREPLTEDLSKYRMPEAMKDMMQEFHDTIAVTTVSNADYERMETETALNDDEPTVFAL